MSPVVRGRDLEMDERELRAAVEMGRLHRVASGWYATPGSSTREVEAVAAGGRLGCLSGCAAHGLWTPAHPSPHIIIPRSAKRRRPEWHRASGPLPPTSVYPLEECLAQVAHHHDPETTLMVMESSAHLGLVTPSMISVLLAGAGVHHQRTLKFFDPRAESGSETRVRLWLRQNRFPVESQPVLEGVGRFDLKVGSSLLIECDSAEFHHDQEVDRARDLSAMALGYTAIRLSYGQIHFSWEVTRGVLLAALRTRRHLRAPIPLEPA